MTDRAEPGTRELRKFGLLLGFLFALLFSGVPFLRHHTSHVWPLVAAIALWVFALVAPSALRQVHRRWTELGNALGWVNTRVILSLLYAFAVIPIGVVIRLFGRDSMARKFDPAGETYRIASRRRSASHLERPF